MRLTRIAHLLENGAFRCSRTAVTSRLETGAVPSRSVLSSGIFGQSAFRADRSLEGLFGVGSGGDTTAIAGAMRPLKHPSHC